MASATPSTMASPTMVWITLPTTWPISAAPRAMAIVRNRSMMPSVTSVAIDNAVPSAAVATVMIKNPGDDVGEVGGPVCVSGVVEIRSELTAEDVDEQQEEHDRKADELERDRRVAKLVFEVAAQHRRSVAEGVRKRAHR
jgi:hypothetical protein